jgi:hypothetical protein
MDTLHDNLQEAYLEVNWHGPKIYDIRVIKTMWMR